MIEVILPPRQVFSLVVAVSVVDRRATAHELHRPIAKRDGPETFVAFRHRFWPTDDVWVVSRITMIQAVLDELRFRPRCRDCCD
jgi:hypothetical protein